MSLGDAGLPGFVRDADGLQFVDEGAHSK